jgi:predicted phage terminase large subunit-like protein
MEELQQTDDTLELTDEQLLDLDNQLTRGSALESLYYLNKEVLKHQQMTDSTHGEFCKLVDDWETKHSLFLLPRGTFKSSIITEGYTIQTLLRDPNKMVLVYCETYTKALDYVRAIREHIEDEVCEVFGNVKDQRYWREEGFRVSGRTKKGKEASVTPSGIDKPATGYHYDLIICDDLLGETNTNTADQMEKVKRRFQELHSILNPGGRIVVIGTIWDEDDLYCNIIKSEGVDSKDWDKLLKDRVLIGKHWNVYIRQAKDDNGYFFPELLNEESLSKIENGQSVEKHKMQYYNDPRRLTNTVFTEEMRDKAKSLYASLPKGSEGRPETTERYILVDPAISQTERADFTGIIELGVTQDGIWVVLQALQVKLDTEQLLDTIITMQNQSKPKMVSLESRGFQKVIVQWLHKKRKELGLYFRVFEYDPGNKESKAQRIETLLPRFKQGGIAYSEDMVELDQQLRKYPDFTSREHEDVLDALAQATTVVQRRMPLPVNPEDMKDGIRNLF